MNPLLSYFWPAFGLGLLFGVISGAFGFRLPRTRSADQLAGEQPMSPEQRRRRGVTLSAGALLSLAAAGLWHGPFGAAEGFATSVERALQQTLTSYEMTQVTAHLHHDPLSREVMLSGPADDFQRSELVRIIGEIAGVRSASWSPKGGGLPLIAEGFATALLGFLLGLLLAYLVELRRRYNSQWNW